MTKLLYTIKWDSTTPTLEQVSAKYDFPITSMDKDFGVVLIDPEGNLYSIMVEENAVTDQGGIEGPFSNPRIENFGPPESNDT